MGGTGASLHRLVNVMSADIQDYIQLKADSKPTTFDVNPINYLVNPINYLIKESKNISNVSQSNVNICKDNLILNLFKHANIA